MGNPRDRRVCLRSRRLVSVVCQQACAEALTCFQFESDLPTALERRGNSRYRFLGFCAAMTATLALPIRYVRVQAALESADRPILACPPARSWWTAALLAWSR